VVVRAIHLELVEDMSADEFLLWLRCFMARRGVPRQIISDNAKQFKAAKQMLSEAKLQTANCVDDYKIFTVLTTTLEKRTGLS